MRAKEMAPALRDLGGDQVLQGVGRGQRVARRYG
jgi:hypothetical protein